MNPTFSPLWRLCFRASFAFYDHFRDQIFEKGGKIEQYFDEDIAFLNNCGLPIYTPATLDYDLKDYINYIVAKKEN